jgi:hypothetical protein
VKLSRPNAKDVGQTKGFIAKPGRSLSTGWGHALDVAGLDQVNKASQGFNQIVPATNKAGQVEELRVVSNLRPFLRREIHIQVDMIKSVDGKQLNAENTVKGVVTFTVNITIGFTVNFNRPTQIVEGIIERH